MFKKEKIALNKFKNWVISELKTLSKAQISAFIGGMVDYATMIYLTDKLHIYFTYSIIVSGFVGAIVNFTLNRTWSFKERDKEYSDPLKYQLLKFIPVVLNSVFLKSFITYSIVRFTHLNYKISRILTDIIVSVGVNYPLQKIWVFRKKVTLDE